MQKGKASIQFEDSPYITSAASVAGTKEGEGPLGALFDVTEQDDMMGQENWEAAESSLQKKAGENPISFCRGSSGAADCDFFRSDGAGYSPFRPVRCMFYHG